MNFKTLTLILFILLFTDTTYGQRNRRLSSRNSVPLEKVDVEIQKQLSLLFEAKELKSLISGPTITFKEFEKINKINFKNYKIQDKAIEVLNSSELTANNNLNYFYIVGWSDVLNMLNIEIVHQETKTKVKVLLTKKGNDWIFGTSELISEKKPEPQESLLKRKSLRRRG